MTASAPPIVLELRRSRAFDAGLALAVLLALVAVLASALPVSLAWVVIAAIGLIAARALRAHRAQVGLRLGVGTDGQASLRPLDSAEAINCRITDHAMVGPFVTLRLGAGAPLRRLFLLPDSTDPDALRRLRVRLRGLAPATGGDAVS